MSIENASRLDAAAWRRTAQEIQPRLETRHFIDGAFAGSASGEHFATINPATGETLAEVALAGQTEVDKAVSAARAAFRDGRWSRIAPRERMAVMYRWSELVDANAEQLAVLESLDMGKPISDVLAVDLPTVVETLHFMGECCDKIEGKLTSTEQDVLHMVIREPLGVVAAITPWNYPLLMAVWKIAPALAAGNTVVLKPAEQAPLSCLRLAELFMEAGGPAGVLNVINGPGEITGKALALNDDVAKIAFTGSTEVGKLLLQYAGQSNMKKVALECGGKTPQIFLGDLPDMQRAVAAAYNGIYANMGEVCNAGSRLLVQRSILDEFVQRFVAEGRDSYVPGDPLDPDTSLGPLVTREAQGRVLDLVASGSREGARLEFGGGVPDGFGHGAYIQPALFTSVRPDMRIAREEIFGPVASVIPFDDAEEALAIANDSIYGLAASVWTKDIDRALRLVRRIEAGVVWVNCFDEADMTLQFGGYKQSGNARDSCFESVLEYTQSKSAWIRIGSSDATRP